MSTRYHERRRQCNLKVHSTERDHTMDLREVTFLSKSEIRRIQEQLKNVDSEQERNIEKAKCREAMHLQSKEVVKLWSNTLLGERQEMLKEKIIREKIEEEKRQQLDLEEARYKEGKRKEAIEKAKTQLFNQTDRVKGLHGAYLLSHALKERGAQIELKQRIKDAATDMDKTLLEENRARNKEALRKEEEKAHQKKVETLAVEEELKKQIRKNKLEKEQGKLLKQKEWEEIQRLHELHLWEQRRAQEQQTEKRKQLMQAQQEHLTNIQLEKEVTDQKEQMEEEQRKLYLATKQKMTKLRRDKEKDLIRETQMHREKIWEKLATTRQEQIDDEDLKITRAVAEREAREALQMLEKEQRRAALMESIITHRESLRKEKERLKEMTKLKNQDILQAEKAAQQLYEEKLQLKAKKKKEELQRLQEFHRTQMVEKQSKQLQQKQDHAEFESMNKQLREEEEYEFQLYATDVINTAEAANFNIVPLYKAALEGIGGGSGPAFNGVRPSYVVQDSSGAQMPSYISGTTQNIKMLNVAQNIEHAKKRLGFTYQ